MGDEKALNIASFVIGIPSFLALLFGDSAVLPAITLLLAFALIQAAYYKTKLLLPEFTMLSTTADWVILDANAAKATFSRKVRYRRNHKYSHRLVFDNIKAEGPTDNFKWNDEDISSAWIKTVFQVEKVVTIPVGTEQDPGPWWGEKSGTLSYEVCNGFPSKEEFVKYKVERPTKQAVIRVQLPDNRPCKRAWSKRILGSAEEDYGKPDVTDNNRTIEWHIGRPRWGYEYALFWEW